MGGLKGRAKSFTVDDATPERTELFLKCWEHNLEWAPTLVKEWSNLTIKNPMFRHGLRLVFSYAIKQGKKLIRLCRDECNCDLKVMIDDSRKGKIGVAPLGTKLLYRLLKLKPEEE